MKHALADITARVASETEADLAAGRPGRHAGRTYELAGATAIGGDDIAAALTRALDRPVVYRPASLAETRQALGTGDLRPYQVGHTLSLFANIAGGLLARPGDDLTALLRTPPRPALELIAHALASVS